MKRITIEDFPALKEGDELEGRFIYGGGWLTGKTKVELNSDGELAIRCQHGLLTFDFYIRNFNSYELYWP